MKKSINDEAVYLMNVGERIRLLQKTQGVTQRELVDGLSRLMYVPQNPQLAVYRCKAAFE